MRWLIVPVAALVLLAACGGGDGERIDALEERVAELEAELEATAATSTPTPLATATPTQTVTPTTTAIVLSERVASARTLLVPQLAQLQVLRRIRCRWGYQDAVQLRL